jgi:S-adenosyl methyltransferase
MQGGKNNYEIDREAAAEWIEIDPGVEPYAKDSRPFIQRVVRYLAGEGVHGSARTGDGRTGFRVDVAVAAE